MITLLRLNNFMHFKAKNIGRIQKETTFYSYLHNNPLKLKKIEKANAIF